MAYVAPTITASGTTFAQLQSGGLHVLIDNLIAANSFTAPTLAYLNAAKHGRLQDSYEAVRQRIDDYTHGDPVVLATFKTEMLGLATTFAALIAALNEVNVLIDANGGTLTTAPTRIGIPRPVRTFP